LSVENVELAVALFRRVRRWYRKKLRSTQISTNRGTAIPIPIFTPSARPLSTVSPEGGGLPIVVEEGEEESVPVGADVVGGGNRSVLCQRKLIIRARIIVVVGPEKPEKVKIYTSVGSELEVLFVYSTTLKP
jgi:hypothetical protein